MDNKPDNKYFIGLYRFTKSLIFISLSFEIIMFLLYLMGNYQSFLDKTQLLILKTLSINSIISFVICFSAIIEMIFLIILKDFKISNLLRIIPVFLVLIFNVIILAYSTIVIHLSEGI